MIYIFYSSSRAKIMYKNVIGNEIDSWDQEGWWVCIILYSMYAWWPATKMEIPSIIVLMWYPRIK